MPRWTRIRGRGRSLSPVRSPLLFLFLFQSLSGLFGGEKREACVGTSTPAALVGSRLRVEVLRSGSGGGESHLHLHSDIGGRSGAHGVWRARR
ncbi:hypothetical protein B0H14DRAFT_2963554 [Mycena olivaceomarginata]|nr:hypothetical protein B0H14DRAFT_2963554 [Mycena olivaceomarginata]